MSRWLTVLVLSAAGLGVSAPDASAFGGLFKRKASCAPACMPACCPAPVHHCCPMPAPTCCPMPVAAPCCHTPMPVHHHGCGGCGTAMPAMHHHTGCGGC